MQLPQLYSKLNRTQRKLVREQYMELQGGKCYWCGGLLQAYPPERILNTPINWTLFPPYFLRYPIHLQHNHVTDETEGAVHAYCNAVMWQYHGR
jgi:hypothetical protein